MPEAGGPPDAAPDADSGSAVDAATSGLEAVQVGGFLAVWRALHHETGTGTRSLPLRELTGLNRLIDAIGHQHATPEVLAQQLKLRGVFRPVSPVEQAAMEAALAVFAATRHALGRFRDRMAQMRAVQAAAAAPPADPLPREDTALELVDAPGATF